MDRKFKNLEEPPVFIMGDTVDGTLEIVPNRFFGISGKKNFGRKTVILCNVVKGKIAVGEEIVIMSPDGSFIKEMVKKIEKNKTSISVAVTGDEVGVQLTHTKLRELRNFNLNIVLSLKEV